MKQIFVLLMLLLVLGSCDGDKDIVIGQKTTMEVDPVYDAGDVLKGEKINAKFTVKNTGDYPLVIADVKPSCSCTVARFPEEPIKPGETGEIVAHVDTDKTGGGPLNKAVRIVANTEPSITQVVIKANVKTK